MERMKQYYTPEQMAQFAELGKQTPPETIREIEMQWTALLAEMRVKRDLDPASAEARALADRWDALTARTVEGYQQYPELSAAIKQHYDSGRFEDVPEAPHADDFALIARIRAAHDQSGDAP